MDYRKKYLKYKQKYLKYNIGGTSEEISTQKKDFEENLIPILNENLDYFSKNLFKNIIDNYNDTIKLIRKYEDKYKNTMLEEYKFMISEYHANIQDIKDMIYNLLHETPLVHNYINILRTRVEKTTEIKIKMVEEIIKNTHIFIRNIEFFRPDSFKIFKDILTSSESEEINEKITEIYDLPKIDLIHSVYDIIIPKYILKDLTTLGNLLEKIRYLDSLHTNFNITKEDVINYIEREKNIKLGDLFEKNGMSFIDLINEHYLIVQLKQDELTKLFITYYKFIIKTNLTTSYTKYLKIGNTSIEKLMSVDIQGREYKELYFDELIDRILGENNVDFTLDEITRKKFLEYLYDLLKDHLKDYKDYETYKSIDKIVKTSNYEDYKNEMDNQKIKFEKFFEICGAAYLFLMHLPPIYFMINFILKEKIITLFKEEVDLENIITQNYSYLLDEMKSIYIINDLMQTYYWKYELDKINPSKSDVKNISKINIEQLLTTIDNYDHTQSTKQLEFELKNYTLKLKNITNKKAEEAAKQMAAKLIADEEAEKKAKTEQQDRKQGKNAKKRAKKRQRDFFEKLPQITEKIDNIDYINKFKGQFYEFKREESDLNIRIKTEFERIINNSQYVFSKKVEELNKLIKLYDNKIDLIIHIAKENEKEQEGEEQKKTAKSIINLIESIYLNNKLNKLLNSEDIDAERLGFYLSDSDSAYLKSTDILTYITFKKIERNNDKFTKFYNQSIHAHIGIDNRIENYDVLDDDLGTQGRITLTLTCNINKISDRKSMESFLHESYDEYFKERIDNGLLVLGNPTKDKKTITIENDKIHINILGRQSLLFEVDGNIEYYENWIKQYMEFLKIVPILLITN